MGYEDKSYQQIHDDLLKGLESKKNKEQKIRESDIYFQGKQLIARYINEIKKDPKMNFGPWALKPLIGYWKVLDKCQKEKNSLVTLGSKKKDIQILVSRINLYENEALERLARNNTYRANLNEQRQAEKKLGGKIFDIKNDTFVLTDKVNPLKVHEVLDAVCENQKVYKIDYTNCKDEKIKKKMMDLIGGSSCWITYDQKSKTYLLRDKNGDVLSNRALIWGGVTLREESLVKFHSKGQLSQTDKKVLQSVHPSKELPFSLDDYSFYVGLRSNLAKWNKGKAPNICSSYALGCSADILSRKGIIFKYSDEPSAWKLASCPSIKRNFSINKFVSGNEKEQILSASAGSLLTLRYNKSSATSSGVSHVMVSLGNGVYSDLVGSQRRKVDFKNIDIKGKAFTINGSSYSLTEDSCVMKPLGKEKGSFQTFSSEKKSPDDFAKEIQSKTGLGINYVRMIIARQNNLKGNDFWDSKPRHLSVRIITTYVSQLDIHLNEGKLGTAGDFLDSIKKNKAAIMRRYPHISNHEYDEIAKRAMGVLYQESNASRFLNDDGSFSKGNAWLRLKELGHMLINSMATTPSTPTTLSTPGTQNQNFSLSSALGYSRGYTQIKFNQVFTNEDKKFLKTMGVNSDNDLTDAGKCGIATMVGLIGNYNRTILPMKRDSFWKNDAEIIELKFNDGEKESIARGKALNINGTRRPRTDDEIQEKIKEWGDKHGGIAEQRIVIRPGITRDDDFFDFLYYAWNKPSEIYYGTATPNRNNYIAQSKGFIDGHLTA